MSLDLSILGDDGAPRASVAIENAAHSKLMKEARGQHLHLILRMSDFYADATIRASEVAAFVDELNRLDASGVDADVRRLAAGMRALARDALASGKDLEAIAD
jgi:hypothetical protein